MSFVSVVLPVVGSAAELEAAVRTIRERIRQHWKREDEVIAVVAPDDRGCDDYCRKEKLLFARAPVRPTFGRAANVGVRLSRGDHVLVGDIRAFGSRWPEWATRLQPGADCVLLPYEGRTAALWISRRALQTLGPFTEREVEPSEAMEEFAGRGASE